MSGNGKSLVRSSIFRPAALEEIMRPWSEWLEDKWPLSSQMPAVNVKESNKDYEIFLAAPGLEKNDFKIDVNGTTLTISAEKDEKREDKEDGYYRKEYNYKSFSRSFTLPEDIMKDKIDASYTNGELIVKLPKKEESTKAFHHQKISVH